jgi:signal transduction histidine kinase/CheY-like chemotaxis protein
MNSQTRPDAADVSVGGVANPMMVFVASSPLALAITDADLRLAESSPAWRRAFAVGDKARRQRPLDADLPGSAEQFAGLMADPVDGATAASLVQSPPARDGSIRWLRVEATPWRDAEGEAAGLLLTSQDVTEMVEGQERAQAAMAMARDEAEAANVVKSEFLANMSHEIRTPMNGVIGMNALLLRTALTPDQRKYAEAVRVSADCLLSLINDILDISKLEAGKVDLEEIDFTLDVGIEDVVELLSPRAAERGLEICAFLDEGARRAFSGDPTRLRQIVLNLLSNALKFTEQGFVAVEVHSRPAGADRAHLRIEVQDTGIGLSAEAKSKLFQKFQQADGSVTRKYGGTGLGLSICRQLIELMGGRIGVDDRPGGGSLFWVEVELRHAKHPVTRAAPSSRDLAGARILVVDDIEINRQIFIRQLQAEGAEVSDAVDGPSALAAIAGADARGAPYDIVLLDQMMPGLSGDQVASKIRANGALIQPRLVLASSIGAPMNADPAAHAGFDAILIKPIRHDALIARLGALLAPAAPQADAVELWDASDIAPAPPVLQAAAIAAGRSGRLLLAEDNEINTMLARTILEQAGYDVDCVVNGAEAVEAARQGGFDAILMDMQMPVMDGLEATRRIRALEGPASATPIIAMTANAMRKDHDACVAAGMNEFISKPIEADSFLATIARFMGAELWEDATHAAAAARPTVDIDPAKLDGLARLLPAERLLQIINGYLAAARGRLAQIENLAEAMDFAGLAREAHDLKATAGTFGAERLRALAEQLERACQSHDDAEAPRLVGEISRASVIAWSALDDWVERWKAATHLAA